MKNILVAFSWVLDEFQYHHAGSKTERWLKVSNLNISKSFFVGSYVFMNLKQTNSWTPFINNYQHFNLIIDIIL